MTDIYSPEVYPVVVGEIAPHTRDCSDVLDPDETIDTIDSVEEVGSNDLTFSNIETNSDTETLIPGRKPVDVAANRAARVTIQGQQAGTRYTVQFIMTTSKNKTRHAPFRFDGVNP